MATRRRVLRAMAALVVAWLAGPASAQDPSTSVVQAAARDWLALADKGDACGTLDAAGAQFRKAMSRERWSETLTAARKPLGALQQRAMLATTFRKQIRGAPPGEYALVLFRSVFADKGDANETVTLEHEPDGRWRVVGYSIQ